jgi:hypothetical protein
MVIGRAEGGRPLFSVETRIHRSRNWVRWVVRGISEVDTAAWQPWPDETLVIRVDDDAFAVLGRTGATLRSPVPLPAPLAAPTAADVGACGAVAE